MTQVLIWLLTVILILAGFLGTLLPILPGPFLVWLGIFLFAALDGFTSVSIIHVSYQALLAVLTVLVDWASQVLGIKRQGGSRGAVWGAVLGAIIGPFLLGIIGLVVGPLVMAFLVELLIKKSPLKALKVSLGTLIGLLGGTFLKIFIVIIMIVLFFYNAVIL